MSQMTLITGPERRRRWSEEQKLSILAAAAVPGAVVSEVARRADPCTSLIYRWRREGREAAGAAGFVPAQLIEDAEAVAVDPTFGGAAIMVELAGGARVSIGASAPAALVTATLRALR